MHKAAILVLFASALPAQNHFVPADNWFVRIELRDLPGIAAVVEPSALGTLLRSEDLQDTVSELRRTRTAATTRYVVLENHARKQSLLTADELIMSTFYGLDLGDLQHVMLAAFCDKASQTPWPTSLAIVTPLPRAEGRSAAAFQDLCRQLEHSIDTERQGEQKIGGFPADVFGPRQRDEDRSFLPEWYGHFSLLHLPGEFVYATGDMLKSGHFGPTPAPAGEPGLDLSVRLQNMPSGTEEMQQLGFDVDGALRLSLRIRDRLLQAEAAADVTPGGLLAALLHGNAALPRQPMPAGGLLQLRLALDGQGLLQALKSLQGPLGGMGLGDGLQPWLQTLTGGVALGLLEPAPGGVIPRVWLSLSLQDPAAFATLVQGLPQGERGLQFETRKLAGHDCTLVRVPDLPKGLQPCYCVVDGTLHLAETTASLTQLLRNLQGDGEAMPVGAAPLPAGDGEPLPSFDLRFDHGALYRTYRKVWMQPLRLLLAVAPRNYFPIEMLQPLTDPDLLPPVDVIEQHVEPGRAVLRRHGKHVVYQEASALGGPLLTPLFGFYVMALLTRSGEGSEWRLQALSNRIETHQLEQLATALQKFEHSHHKKAQSLAELAAAGLLGEDTLRLPDDDSPDTIAFTDREQQPRTLRSSFVFVPEGIAVQSYASHSTLVAVRRRPAPSPGDAREQIFASFNTVFLDTDGTVREEYGDDDFQKAVQRARATGDKH